MELTEFTWDHTGEGMSLDVRITQHPDGSCQIKNLRNEEETYETDSPRSAADAMSQLMSETA